MNLHSLQQLNQDFNGAVVALLEAVVDGKNLEFYSKGVTFPAQGFEFWEPEEDNRYCEYAHSTTVIDFYSMLGMEGLDYSYEVGEFTDGRADQVDSTEQFLVGKALKKDWVLAPVIIQACPELFQNLIPGGERHPDNEGTFYHDLGLWWEVDGGELQLDRGVATSILNWFKTGEDSIPKNPRQAAAMGLPTKLFV